MEKEVGSSVFTEHIIYRSLCSNPKSCHPRFCTAGHSKRGVTLFKLARSSPMYKISLIFPVDIFSEVNICP